MASSDLEMFSTKINRDLKKQIKELSDKTRIPQARLVTEALEDLIKKHNDNKEL